MSGLRQRYLAAMGIQVWERRAAAPTSAVRAEPSLAETVAVPSVDVPPPVMQTASRQSLDALDWEALADRVAECTACAALVANRTQTVFGVGNRSARWMVIGEAPGADEDKQGEPFVGRAGQLLNAMLTAIGQPREQVYIANIIKCRPPNNRDPQAEEAANCEPFLLRQIQLIQPRVILAVGRISAQNLLKTDVPVGKLRGRVHGFRCQGLDREIPVVVTYHPAYLLRSPLEKRKAWQDLKLARQVFQADSPQ